MKVLFICILFIASLSSFEVNTHQALTRCAITTSCENGEAENLTNFINHARLKNQFYNREIFESYGKTYQAYVQTETASKFNNWHIKIGSDYLGMIEAGSVLEDAVYPTSSAPDFMKAGDGRFNNHFYAAQFNAKNSCNLTDVFQAFPHMGKKDEMLSTRALCLGYEKRTDNIDWVLNRYVNLGQNRVNDYGLEDAFWYFYKSFSGTVDARRKYQAKLFVSLGHMVHMLQDLHSPAHCRDNAHANGDYLEIYGRYSGGFRLYDGAFDSRNNGYINNGIYARGSASTLLYYNN